MTRRPVTTAGQMGGGGGGGGGGDRAEGNSGSSLNTSARLYFENKPLKKKALECFRDAEDGPWEQVACIFHRLKAEA